MTAAATEPTWPTWPTWPVWSETLYLRLARADVALFRFLLEGWEGLALFTSLGADEGGRETLLLRHAPGARAELLRFLDAAGSEIALERLPALAGPPHPQPGGLP